jgi:hypothetical protein
MHSFNAGEDESLESITENIEIEYDEEDEDEQDGLPSINQMKSRPFNFFSLRFLSPFFFFRLSLFLRCRRRALLLPPSFLLLCCCVGLLVLFYRWLVIVAPDD